MKKKTRKLIWSRADSVQPRSIEQTAASALLVSMVTFQPQSILPDFKGTAKVKTSKSGDTYYDRKLKFGNFILRLFFLTKISRYTVTVM